MYDTLFSLANGPGAFRGSTGASADDSSVTHGAALYVVLVVFLATLIRSALGFGEALFAVPLLALFLPLTVAAPLAVLLSITIAGFIVIQDWRKIHFRSTGWLIFATLFGIPLGLLLLTSSHQQTAKLALAVLLMAFSAYSLFGPNRLELKTDNLAWLFGCGFFAGLFGGAFGMNGPPLAIYGSLRRWSPQHFRATLQGYFLPASLLGMAGYWSAGLWVPAVTHFYLISLPAVLLAILLGRFLNHRLRPETYLKYVYSGLAVIAAVLFFQAISH